MQTLLPQLTLSLSSKDDATFDDFYAGKNNEEVVSALKNAAFGSGLKIIYLCAKQGIGVSHLLQAVCHESAKHQLRSFYLPLRQLLYMSKDALNGLEAFDLVCVDDIDTIAGNHEWEVAIFDLFNRLYDADKRIIIAGHYLPNESPIQLPDLVSRLSFAALYQLVALSDDEKLIALNMRAHKRGMSLSQEVGKYLLTHCPRHMNTLFAALDTLDRASLAAQRRLTIPFVKEILQI